MNSKFKLIIPAIPQDIEVFLNNASYFFEFLAISKIVFIGPSSIKYVLPSDDRYEFIDENDVLDITALKRIYAKKLNGKSELKKFGWYVQQFLKMAYSLRCKDEYYLLWDADTIPLREISLFDSCGKPYLDYKTEYVDAYFKTLSRVLPGYSKVIKGSFIAEHMLIKTSLMREIIYEIEHNNHIDGFSFEQKIINAIDMNYIIEGGFSEFETYGTYIIKNHRESYTLRRWYSMRFGGYFYNHNALLPMSAVSWMAKHYNAVSIEKWCPLSCLSPLINNRWFTKFFPASILEVFTLLIRMSRRIKRIVFKRK